jgi:hypothetical protein
MTVKNYLFVVDLLVLMVRSVIPRQGFSVFFSLMALLFRNAEELLPQLNFLD